MPRERPVAKLFRLPRNARYMRLIYLIHLSHADHEMALVTATEPAGLDALTREVQLHPATGCRSSRGRVCISIPPGIAVRPEVRKTSNGVGQWLPAL